MARLLWLADVLRAAGLTVHEVAGWRERGSDTYAPRGVIIHETRGSATSTDAGEISVLLNGSNTAPPPIAQLYLSRSGAWWVVASGRCNHVRTGWAGPFSGLGNSSLLGIEAQHAASENWAHKPAQYDAYVRGVAAILRHTGWPAPVGHKEHQTGDKPDPAFSMPQFRTAVASAPIGDDMTPEQAKKLDQLHEWSRYWDGRIHALSTGRDTVDPEWYSGANAGESSWPVRTLKELQRKVDTIAVGGIDPGTFAAAVKRAVADALQDPAVVASLVEAARQGANEAEDS